MPERNLRIEKIMQEAVNVSRRAFGDILRQVWLFGSYAGGTADIDSDVDFMVVLSEPVETWKIIDTVFGEFSIDMLDRYGELPSVFITDTGRFNEGNNLFYETVKKEGMLYYIGDCH